MQKLVPFAEANNRKYPEPVAIAIAKDAAGKFNPISLGWSMQTSFEPPMLAISVGKTRYSHDILQQADAFTVVFASSSQVADARHFGSHSGRDGDKLAAAKTPTQPATKIDGVLLAGAVANFECRKVGTLDTGDHVIFVGEVVASHVHEDPSVRRLYSLGDNKMGSVATR